ncbi:MULTISPECIES: NUDIX hydrolase [Actinosynnema]|uniref:NUDIX hydrolase n=1 Tax=Actinosynnema TaxID=40566 RepID=UPI0020A3F541|nr:NUDIX hydrolase [Actinosynnema pretiosum]MCP2093507.1 ADP-ribose pyrophosphatase YjhB, NUDIX family [Actinosynnema pretiosum]
MTQLNPRKFRVAAYAVVIDDGKMLLSRWIGSGDKLWILPGGGVEFGEDPYDAVIREVHEETGYHVEVQRLLGMQTSVGKRVSHVDGLEYDYHRLRIIYEAKVVGGELTFEVDGSTDEAAWFPLDQVPALDHVESVDFGLELLRAAPPHGHLPSFT